jgi:hypothetical protein
MSASPTSAETPDLYLISAGLVDTSAHMVALCQADDAQAACERVAQVLGRLELSWVGEKAMQAIPGLHMVRPSDNRLMFFAMTYAADHDPDKVLLIDLERKLIDAWQLYVNYWQEAYGQPATD